MSRRPRLGWQLARLVAGGSRRQAFLDQPWIVWILRAAPRRLRRGLALRILSLSPHYFIYQWDGYPPSSDRRQVLEAELERNRRSRHQIAAQVLIPRLRPDSVVLDFGCGPGFIASELHPHAQEVIAVDVSRGTLACAEELNPGPSYRRSVGAELPVADATVDLVYAVAVFQHLDPRDWPAYFREFRRVLRPGGTGVCHFPLAEAQPAAYRKPAGPRACYSLRFEQSTSQTVMEALAAAGFTDAEVIPVAELANVDDDVGRQHLVLFRRPATA